MQPWSSALSACSGAWDALWLMKREGQGGGGARSEPEEREWAKQGVWMWNTARRVTSCQKDLPMWGKGRKYANFPRRTDHLARYVLRSDWVFCGTQLLLPWEQFFTFGLEASSWFTTRGMQDIAISPKQDLWLKQQFSWCGTMHGKFSQLEKWNSLS